MQILRQKRSDETVLETEAHKSVVIETKSEGQENVSAECLSRVFIACIIITLRDIMIST